MIGHSHDNRPLPTMCYRISAAGISPPSADYLSELSSLCAYLHVTAFKGKATTLSLAASNLRAEFFFTILCGIVAILTPGIASPRANVPPKHQQVGVWVETPPSSPTLRSWQGHCCHILGWAPICRPSPRTPNPNKCLSQKDNGSGQTFPCRLARL